MAASGALKFYSMRYSHVVFILLNTGLQFVILKPLSYCFKETIRFYVKASFASRPLSRLIRWYNRSVDITKEYWEKAIQFHGTFHGLKIIIIFMDWKLYKSAFYSDSFATPGLFVFLCFLFVLCFKFSVIFNGFITYV